ncbi:MAG: hypothetical protein WDN31_10885 [Hyphomicrobium sp.]
MAWYTNPFKSPIYYGARVAQWFSGGKAGAGIDFIHSKAIAPLDDEANFSARSTANRCRRGRASRTCSASSSSRTATTCCCSTASCACRASGRA